MRIATTAALLLTAWLPGGLPAEEALRVTSTPLNSGTISPLQYGQFIEYLCNLVPGMWAEKLYDGSFEGLTPYKVAFLKETDFREKPWYPSGEVNRAQYSKDPVSPVSGLVSQKIAVKDQVPCTVGISQDGIAVKSGQPCNFTCYARQEGLHGPVEIHLHYERMDAVWGVFEPGPSWKKFAIRLTPKFNVTNATLSISFRGPGTLWLDNASLMPQDNQGGWRPDVVEAVRALKPGIIRFGGSALDDANLGEFDWRDSIGDPDRRKPFRAWGGLQPTGPGLEEIVQFCRLVDAEPLLCVRFSGKTPKDAADQVQYFNGPADSPQGKIRAHNGHPEPYRIVYWQIGNERGGKEYETRLPEFAKAMKEADPTIKLLSSYPSEGVLRHAGQLLDYVCPHHYDIADLRGAANDLDAIAALCRNIQPERPIQIGVTEWNTTGGDWGTRRARLWTLENALACSRYHNLLHRYAANVSIANRSNLTNSFCSGIIQTDNHRLYKTPTYYAQQLYATLAGSKPLKVESKMPSDQGPDFSATLSADGSKVTLFAVNFSPGKIRRPLDFSAFGDQAQSVTVWTLSDRDRAGEPDAANSFADPIRVQVTKSKIEATSPQFDYVFPPLSLTVLQWMVRSAR
jgi:alpha-N-arabinofuranosidase